MTKRSALSKVEFDVITTYYDFDPRGRFTQLYHYTNADAKQKIVDGKKLDFQLTKQMRSLIKMKELPSWSLTITPAGICTRQGR